eukprot:CAMPEP_0197133822 /NCGR_PEP_ID=MMETSP1390-20130617/26060_1 /TAXON_ID=38833 /ORGANISM="Micromonas sp., Strain CCMP2099" /LENGTH=1053 /DNA_ID=CAMNT_0042576521 /DNA_START=181 /DNA_END=3342 /DNA_ORIENTATION=+
MSRHRVSTFSSLGCDAGCGASARSPHSHARPRSSLTNQSFRVVCIALVVTMLVSTARAEPFTTSASLKSAVDRCLDVEPSGENCCSRETGAANCGPAGTTDMPDWDVSQVTNMDNLFNEKSSFNQDISRWDYEESSGMYDGPPDAWQRGVSTPCTDTVASPFTNLASLKSAVDRCLDVEPSGENCCSSGLANCGPACAVDMPDWDVSQVTNMDNLFNEKSSFNQDISRWDTSSVTSMRNMFNSASSFTASDLADWNVGKVTDMYRMFGGRWDWRPFNLSLSRWDVGEVTTMGNMFSAAYAFNSDISAWDVSKVTDMSSMFYYCYEFASDLSEWDVNAVTDMSSMFYNARAFDSDISEWGVSNVQSMSAMFRDATAFSADITGWSVYESENDWDNFYSGSMFEGAAAFIGNFTNCGYDDWDTSVCTRTYEESSGMYDGPPDAWQRGVSTPCTDTVASPFTNLASLKSESSGMYDGPPDAWQRIDCDASTAPKNGTVGDCDATLERGVECAPTCDVGFTVSGKSSCDANGVLAAAICNSQCASSTPPSDGGVGDCPEYLDSGDTCQPTCNAGHAVTGPSTCDSGVISPALCLDTSGPACDASIAPENGGVGDCTETLMSGTTCQPTCDAGFTVSRFSYCDGGEYTAATCSISPTSCATSPPANGAAGDCPPSGVLETSASCQPTCSSAYLASGVTSCELGVLTSTTCMAGTCAENERVVSNACVACSPGTQRPAGDNMVGEDTECNAILCAINERVLNNACTTCPSGVANVEGDDASGDDTECDGDACSTDFRVLNNMCVACLAGTIRPAGDDPRGSNTVCSLGSLESEEKAKIEKAIESRDAMLTGIVDEATKKKALLLADAAIAGATVTKFTMSIAAASEDAACDVSFEKMRLDSSLGACEVVYFKRRRLAQTSYDVFVFLSSASVDETTLNAAFNALQTEGVAVTSTETDPIVELRAIPGIGQSALVDFETDAVAAAEASGALASAEEMISATTPPPSPPPSPPSPPPPSPPPNRLVFNDYDSPAARLECDVATRLLLFAAAVELIVWREYF